MTLGRVTSPQPERGGLRRKQKPQKMDFHSEDEWRHRPQIDMGFCLDCFLTITTGCLHENHLQEAEANDEEGKVSLGADQGT